MKGFVINKQKGLFKVKDYENGELVNCTLRGRLFKQLENKKSLVVVGDEVEYQPVYGGKGVITEIIPRKSKLSRKGAGKKGRHQEQIIAANIDYALLVFSVEDPPYKLNLIERYIVSAEAGNIEPIICFTKIDLAGDDNYKKDVSHLEDRGYKVFKTSSVTKKGIETLKGELGNRKTVLAGSSGVGKSTLVNLLLEEEIAKTNNVSNSHYKGKHTTTSSTVYELPFGGILIDVPGMREFGIINDSAGIEKTFADIVEIAQNCKFSDCSHTHEPGCAVKAAVDSGEIDERRYLNFLKLMQE
ncbi:MAG: ribosome small subunit-dependent GTPase A [Kosmotoga sp.]|nr:MAG: ribosome small subunit-dependent GTPase A [Kosmotoga sp.]